MSIFIDAINHSSFRPTPIVYGQEYLDLHFEIAKLFPPEKSAMIQSETLIFDRKLIVSHCYVAAPLEIHKITKSQNQKQ